MWYISKKINKCLSANKNKEKQNNLLNFLFFFDVVNNYVANIVWIRICLRTLISKKNVLNGNHMLKKYEFTNNNNWTKTSL